MKTLLKRLALFTVLIWIASSSTAQSSKGQIITEINGVKGVFVPESFYREIIEDRTKGFSYYKQWKMTEVQLSSCDSSLLLYEIEVGRVRENYQLEQERSSSLVELNETLEKDYKQVVELYEKEKKKRKLWMIATPSAFLLGILIVAI